MNPGASRFVLDRIEDRSRAVLLPLEPSDGGEEVGEDVGEGAIMLPASWLPDGATEGDVLQAESLDGGGVRLHRAPEATRRRRERMKELRDSIPKAPPGDLSL